MPHPFIRPQIMRITKFRPELPHFCDLLIGEHIVIIGIRLVTVGVMVMVSQTGEIG
jgi:hypothetical protein